MSLRMRRRSGMDSMHTRRYQRHRPGLPFPQDTHNDSRPHTQGSGPRTGSLCSVADGAHSQHTEIAELRYTQPVAACSHLQRFHSCGPRKWAAQSEQRLRKCTNKCHQRGPRKRRHSGTDSIHTQTRQLEAAEKAGKPDRTPDTRHPKLCQLAVLGRDRLQPKSSAEQTTRGTVQPLRPRHSQILLNTNCKLDRPCRSQQQALESAQQRMPGTTADTEHPVSSPQEVADLEMLQPSP